MKIQIGIGQLVAGALLFITGGTLWLDGHAILSIVDALAGAVLLFMAVAPGDDDDGDQTPLYIHG